MLSPIDDTLVEPHWLSGRVFEWTRVRRFSPFVNLYAVIFLIGGAILPGLGGTATRMGHAEVLYVTELVGLLFTWPGYRMGVRPAPAAAARHPAPAAPHTVAPAESAARSRS